MRKQYLTQLIITSLTQLLLAFAALALILNFFVISFLKETMDGNDRKIVDLIQKSVDRQLLSMERVTKALVYNPTFTPYSLLDDPYKAMEAREVLKTIAVSNPLMEAIGTSYYDDDYLLTNETSALKARYFLQLGFDADKMESRSTLERGYAVNGDVIVFLVPMSRGIQNVPGYFFYVFKREALGKGLFPEMDGVGPGRYVALELPGGERLFDTLPEGFQGGGDYLLSRYESFSNGMVYTFYTHRDHYEGFIRRLLLLFLVSMTGAVFLGAVPVLFFSRMNYRPVKHLAEMLTSEGERKSGKEGEFAQIEKTLVSFMKFSGNPSALHQVEIRGLREDIAGDCINGKHKTRESLVRTLKEGEVGCGESLFCFVRILINHGNGPGSIASDFTFPGATVSCLNAQIDRDQALYLLNSEDRTAAEECLDRFKVAQEEESGIELTLGVGSLHDQPESLAQSFLEASTALEYRLVRGKGKIIYYHSIPKPDTLNMDHVRNLMMQVRQAMLSADGNEIGDRVEEIIRLCSDLSLSGARFVYWNLIRIIRETMDSYSLSRDEKNLLNDLNVSRLTEFETLEDLRKFIVFWLEKVSGLVENRVPDKYEAVCHRVKDYIRENCGDPQLSLGDLSDRLGLSQGHLCRVFKESESKTILQFIKDLRFDKSCSMLRETELPISQIIQQVGYSDQASFTREFKKRYGIPPGRYRERITPVTGTA